MVAAPPCGRLPADGQHLLSCADAGHLLRHLALAAGPRHPLPAAAPGGRGHPGHAAGAGPPAALGLAGAGGGPGAWHGPAVAGAEAHGQRARPGPAARRLQSLLREHRLRAGTRLAARAAARHPGPVRGQHPLAEQARCPGRPAPLQHARSPRRTVVGHRGDEPLPDPLVHAREPHRRRRQRGLAQPLPHRDRGRWAPAGCLGRPPAEPGEPRQLAGAQRLPTLGGKTGRGRGSRLARDRGRRLQPDALDAMARPVPGAAAD